MRISQRIFWLMAQQGHSQKEMSTYTNISTSTISAWKTRGSSPSAEDISTIAEFLGVSLNYLITGEETPSPEQLSADKQELLKKYDTLAEREQGRVLQFMEDLIAAHPSAYDTAEPVPSPKKAKPTAAMLEQKKHLA